MFSQNANVTLRKMLRFYFLDQGHFMWNFCLQTHQPNTMVHSAQQQQQQQRRLTSSVSLSLSTKCCLTNETQIVKRTQHMASVADQLGCLDNFCPVFTGTSICKNASNCPTNALTYVRNWPWYKNSESFPSVFCERDPNIWRLRQSFFLNLFSHVSVSY